MRRFRPATRWRLARAEQVGVSSFVGVCINHDNVACALPAVQQGPNDQRRAATTRILPSSNIPFASLVVAQQSAGDGSDHFGLAANDPSAANPMARIRQRTQYSEPEWVVRWGCRSKGRTICRDAAYCAIGYANSARQ